MGVTSTTSLLAQTVSGLQTRSLVAVAGTNSNADGVLSVQFVRIPHTRLVVDVCGTDVNCVAEQTIRPPHCRCEVGVAGRTMNCNVKE